MTFDTIKRVLCSRPSLQRLNPERPFILRTDASVYAVGAALEQLVDEERLPRSEEVRLKITVLHHSTLQKWESWIGLHPLWYSMTTRPSNLGPKKFLDTPSGPLGLMSRWHQQFSKFDLTVAYIPEKEIPFVLHCPGGLTLHHKNSGI